MQTLYSMLQKALVLVLSVFTISQAQTTYFHQDFATTTSLVNPLPDTGQFSHIILTAPQLSYHKFHRGYVEFVRSQQDSATGGIIRAMRATPFQPNPKTLFIQVKLAAESVQSGEVNAIYFYAGEDFNPVNNSFPGNGIMFSKFVINFKEDSICIKDSESQKTSRWIPKREKVTVTWVLNNADKNLIYSAPESGTESTVVPGTYDLWLNGEPVSLGSKGYPGSSVFSPTKLSNFELRFRNGLGKIRIYDILIREGENSALFSKAIIMPNPVTGRMFQIRSPDIDINTVRLISTSGKLVSVKTESLKNGTVQVRIPDDLPAGIYIVHYNDRQLVKTRLKVLCNNDNFS
ncbi:T9SS type A sorting domain-containing protein [Dyadobacter crusticola]|uniref:T9SS type A sorting domain-containing protein n=1 Tax=Dyadobacter crusticola TaxID=292407 RepID=UPI001E530378|nr:T9SS type A sorting domain-containing protein [Dyadobacter crusticola]